MDVATSTGINEMLQHTPGAVAVSYKGVDGWGHLGLPPGTAFEDPDLMDGQPALVVASGHFPDIGVDEAKGLDRIRGTTITVGEFDWMIARAMRATEDGKEILLLLTDPA